MSHCVDEIQDYVKKIEHFNMDIFEFKHMPDLENTMVISEHFPNF